jgi:hypothetical protein
MFVTPRKRGARGSDAHLPFHFPFAGTARSYCGRLPCSDRGNPRPSPAAADEHAPPCHPRADNGEPAFAGWQNPSGTRSAASSSRHVCDDVPVVGILDSSRRTRVDCSMPISRDACSRSESGSIRWGTAGAGVAAPREGARAVPAVTGRHVRVTVGGVICQIYSEALGAGQDVLCMNTAGSDTTSAGSPRACAGVTIGRQDRDEPATNIVAAN